MRARALLVLIAVSLVSGCWVHRRSDELACTTSADCHGGATCENGYCLAGSSIGCPAPCTDCSLADLFCKIDCTSGESCGDLHCPAGFECQIRCGAGACGDIDCAAATTCDIDCQGAAACHNINCGPGECAISCSAQGCGTVDCRSSCACDVSCPSATACPSMSCPMVFGTDTACTRSGTAGSRCDSGPAGCDTCPTF